jgi:hypothetical protein
MVTDLLFEELDQLRLEEDELVRNIKTYDAFERRMRWKHAPQRLDLQRIHRKDDVGPVEHSRIDAHERILLSAGGPDIEIFALAENSLRGGAAMTIEATNKEDAFSRRRMGHGNSGNLSGVSSDGH